MSESKVPAEKLSEYNIWLDEVIKSASYPRFSSVIAAGRCEGVTVGWPIGKEHEY